MDDHIELGADEVPEGRAFTHPDRTRGDLGALREMAAALRRLLVTPLPARPRPLILGVGTPGGPQHRVVICDDGRLRAAPSPALVGFFAEKRPGLDHTPLTETDDALILEFPAHPGILAYCSLELADGNWGNLVVLESPETRDDWRTSERHGYAAQELGPRHYTVVRLHHGRVPGGLLGDRGPLLDLTKYYDFRSPAPWRAERRLAAAP